MGGCEEGFGNYTLSPEINTCELNLSCNLFKLIMKTVIRKVAFQKINKIFYKSLQVLAYANENDIIGTSKQLLNMNLPKRDLWHSTNQTAWRENT